MKSLINQFLIDSSKDKMTQKIYNLKWNHFNGNLDFNLKELLFGNKLTDVTLVSDDKIAFKAHKFLLGACSPVLRDLLIETFHPQPTIYLGGIHSYELEAILYSVSWKNSISSLKNE